ncbi:MAG TPA: nucleoside phosphorylase [Rectinemataceae bacterium]|nr:nucleoside phosphorylase [Rectinemataceae bacterium]
MSVPLIADKFASQPFFNPTDFIGYVRARGGLGAGPAPEAVILSYQRSLFDHVMATRRTTEAEGYFSREIKALDSTGGRVALAGRFGVGAPAAGVMLEELIAWGVRRFISVGTAGSLRPDLPPGSLVLCVEALRDEGSSYHYAPEGARALPDEALTARLAAALAAQGLEARPAVSWTTDAIYRETPLEVARHRDAGAHVVEMEASALFTIAKFRNVPIAACFSVSDTLAELAWRPEFHAETTEEGLEKLFEAALGSLSDE